MFERHAFLFARSSTDNGGAAAAEGAGSVAWAETVREGESADTKVAIATTRKKFTALSQILTESFMGFPLERSAVNSRTADNRSRRGRMRRKVSRRSRLSRMFSDI